MVRLTSRVVDLPKHFRAAPRLRELSMLGRGLGLIARAAIVSVVSLIAGVLFVCEVRSAPDLPSRPPQFIVISFDNGSEVGRWRGLVGLARTLKDRGTDVRFTFFFSAANLFAYENRRLYKGPRLAVGRSNIGFGGSRRLVVERVAAINAAISDGHEFASHAVGHFQGGSGGCSPGRAGITCGAGWSAAEWTDEFDRFDAAVRDVATNNPGPHGEPAIAAIRNPPVQGFRAPHLSVNDAMFEALKARGMRYDASWPRGAGVEEWPQRHDATGLWLFKMPFLTLRSVDGQPMRWRTLAMDYNFCALQTRRAGHSCDRPNRDPATRARFSDEMLETYKAYFAEVFEGSRAPMHIGHHFTDFQDGSYRRALETFVAEACRHAEVRCVTYAELTDWLESLSPERLESYRAGSFDRQGMPASRLAPGRRVAAGGSPETR